MAARGLKDNILVYQTNELGELHNYNQQPTSNSNKNDITLVCNTKAKITQLIDS